MPKNILEGISPSLAKLVEKATDEQKRAICLPICKLAVTSAGLDEPVVTQALQLLEDGAFEDRRLTAPLKQRFSDLDESYFAAEELYKAGKGTEDAYIALARKARAVDSVLLAFNHDPFVAATWSIYEACAALGGSDQVEAIVKDMLENSR
jgi:hypothetical protein